ncbi:RNA polymerase sigma factor [Alkalimonas collagenimarina]|uniref:RNA polymerase sigma factor n=1 Tax=Alkalimonas collagenimarina TaxID=400390 RepID=UPI00350F1A25
MNTESLDLLYQQYSRQVLSTLIRLLGEFELAEEAMQDAFYAAMQQWPVDGWPEHPVAWLITTGRRKGIDQIRRRQTARRYADEQLHLQDEAEPELDPTAIQDDQLRLIFTCCHPALSADARLALTLRELCGLTTEQVAAALLQKPTTLAQRIVRAKQKIKAAAIPYEIPHANELPARLQSVLQVIYLIYNEGYSSTSGTQLLNIQLADEAIRLGRQLALLLPEPEVHALLALMLLQHARQHARQNANGDLVTLEQQDRTLWLRPMLDEGLQWLALALTKPPAGVYTLQAAIAAVHSNATSYDETDWQQIQGLYQLLYQQWPSPVVALNRAVATAMHQGPEAGLQELDALSSHKAIQNYHLFHAAKADLYRRSGQFQPARIAYQRALALVQQEPERRFLQQRLATLPN